MFRLSLGLRASVRALLLLLACPLAVRGADSKSGPKDADLSGPAFEAQGEYAGEIAIPDGNFTIGIQVVALGKGKFSALTYLGGLPGDGWNRGKVRHGDGEMKDGAVEFKGDKYSSAVKDGALSILLAGVKLCELKKVDRKSPTLGASPPEDAVVLFDGSTANNFENGKMTEDGLLLPGCTSKEKFGSGRLHVEFRVPFMPEARGQARGNSGVFLQGRYEVHVLDSFGEKETNNSCGAIFSQRAPDENMSYPPGAWQTFDIDFKAAEYQSGRKLKDPIITIRLNNVIVIRKAALPHATHGAPVAVGEEPGPIVLQDHKGDAVRYRNIWFAKKAPEKPVE